ncbi:ribosomal protein L4 [Decorospora gaudefroyi]|uniref:Large ribosomal subunit protein uL4m n=1 Tax=Decorospora gaudefroyi TaxID=184978 RepID=A0A6A5KC77_9PLEO|nr:ribosomal protein L4 [Decorospora gaudefroyi]
MRGVSQQLSRVSIRQGSLCCRCTKHLLTPSTRSVSTSAPSNATVASIKLTAPGYVPVKPLEEQTVLATIHRFPSLEPLRFDVYPANHLYLPTRRDILHRAVIYEGDKTRLGTASTKTRHEIHGSARKIRPQKGSGRARLGDKKSPMLRGGGVAFGPKPRDFATGLPTKVYDLAMRTALSYRFRKGELIIVDNAMEIESPSTKLLEDIFKHHEKLRGKGRSRLVTLEERPLLGQALRGMDRGEQTITWDEVDVKDLLELSRIIIERDALHNILLSHETDLTHKALQPWHKSLIRSSRSIDLESTAGWEEFRKISTIDFEEKDTTKQSLIRAEAYESAATTRYAYARSLPEGPTRTELTVSAYDLLADAMELQFAEKTGFPFANHLETKDADAFPRVQALTYQLNVKSQLSQKISEVMEREDQESLIAIQELDVQRLQVQYDATLLAAQIHEHREGARRINGEEDEAEEQLGLAAIERGTLDTTEEKLLEARLELAALMVRLHRRKGDLVKQQEAEEAFMLCKEAVDAKRAEREAQEASHEEGAEDGMDKLDRTIEIEVPKQGSVKNESRL